MPGLWFGIRATIIYAVIIACAMLFVFQFTAAPTDIKSTLAGLLPFQLLATILCGVIAWRSFGWVSVGFGRVRWTGLIWLTPSWIVLAVMASDVIAVLSSSDLIVMGAGTLALLILTTFLIAVGEEVLFRGILLRSALNSVSVLSAMLISAALFGAFHLINAFAGVGLPATFQQVAFAVLVGFYLAPIAIRVGNLWPLIIWHWLWNIVVVASQVVDVFQPLAISGIAIQTVICVWLWTDLTRQPQTT